MTKAKHTPKDIPNKPFREEEEAVELPSFEDQDRSGDVSMFVQFEQPGDTFVGLLLAKLKKGDHNGLDLTYDALLYAEYPSGELKLLPYGYSQGQEIAKQEDNGRDMDLVIQRSTLEKIKKTDEGTKKERTVKLFSYGYMPITQQQRDAFARSFYGDPRLTELIDA